MTKLTPASLHIEAMKFLRICASDTKVTNHSADFGSLLVGYLFAKGYVSLSSKATFEDVHIDLTEAGRALLNVGRK